MNDTIIIDSKNLKATDRIGRRLGAALTCGDVIALIGPLGAGKTMLVKGIAAGAGVVDLRQVNSPTFVIVNEYDAGTSESGLRIYHIDAYRLTGSDDLDALGFDEMTSRGAVIIEWADRVADLLPEQRLNITIEPVSDHRRRLHCLPGGPTSDKLISALSAL